MKYFSITVTVIMVVFISEGCNYNGTNGETKENSNNVFGDSFPVSNDLVGKVFLLPDTTTTLPDFDTMKALDNEIYASEINVPSQSWSSGFPGLHNRFEWFGIEYTCFFKTNIPGNYLFRLLSDDGSKLFIDGKLIIDNDGRHSETSKSGNIFLNDSKHQAKVLYFQGPRYQLALQLFWSLENSQEQIFPGNNFILYTPGHLSHVMWWWLLLSAIILLAVIFFIWQKRQSPPS